MANSVAYTFDTHGFSTKQDILDLRRDIKALENRFDANFEAQRKDNEILKRDIILRLGGMVLASSGLVIAMLKLLLPH